MRNIPKILGVATNKIKCINNKGFEELKSIMPSEAVEGAWEDRTSDLYWESQHPSVGDPWDGEKWPAVWNADIEGGSWCVWLDAIGNWASGYRPTKLRVVIDSVNVEEFGLEAPIGEFPVLFLSGEAHSEKTFEFSLIGDIVAIYFQGQLDKFHVIKIEFFVE